MLTALEISIFCIILKTSSSEVSLRWKGGGALGNLIKGDSAKFERKSLKIFAIVFFPNFNALLLSTALKFEI